MFASSNVIGRDEPSMYVPYPPGPLTSVTSGKTEANVRMWSL